MQLIGDATWTVAGHAAPAVTFTEAHVQQARAAMRTDLEALFRARWEKGHPGRAANSYKRWPIWATARSGAAISRALGATSDELSVARARLIDKGLIEVAGHGQLGFTILGFAEYVRARSTDTTRRATAVDQYRAPSAPPVPDDATTRSRAAIAEIWITSNPAGSKPDARRVVSCYGT